MARGFTLLEMMFVMAAAAILLSVALPSFQTTARNFRLRASVNDIVASMQLARSEAIKRRIPAVICASGGGDVCDNSADWQQGWIVFPDDDLDGDRDNDEPLLQRRDSMRRGIEVSMPGAQPLQKKLIYSPTGFPDVGGLDAAGLMVFCDNQHSDYFGRIVVVPQTGRPVAIRMVDNDYGQTCE